MINFYNNKSEIILNSSIYFPNVLKIAVKAFKKNCNINIKEKGLLQYIEIKTSKKELKDITYEFCNYALALMKSTFIESAVYKKNGQ